MTSEVLAGPEPLGARYTRDRVWRKQRLFRRVILAKNRTRGQERAKYRDYSHKAMKSFNAGEWR